MIKDELLTGDKDEGASHFAELNRELALRAHEENRQRQTDARKAAIDSANVAIRAALLHKSCEGRDSSLESSMVAGMHEQTHTPDLQDHELAGL